MFKTYLKLLPGLLLIFAMAACNSNAGSTADSTDYSEISSPDMNIPDEYKIGGFAIGAQAYTFNRFTLFEAIEKTAAAGGRVIELFPGQALSPEDDTEFDPSVSDEIIDRVLEKLEEHDIMAVNFGVIRLPDPEQARGVFEFAQKMGIPAITTEVSTSEDLDFIEELVEEFDIMVGIHNHPRRENNPDYRIWDPQFVADLVADRDPRIGACADTGHWIRSNVSPVEALQILEGRLISLHLKDVDRNDTEGSDVIYGTGLGNITEVLAELERQNFGGNISIEYESNWLESVPDVGQNIGFVRGYTQSAR